ncbi:MAG: hypothetical protein HY928_05800 [Elusimicrobia bacterium]|nr:hypothetical protein [Elusimicrobiota bacterium]
MADPAGRSLGVKLLSWLMKGLAGLAAIVALCVGLFWGMRAGWIGPTVKVLDGLRPGDAVVALDTKWENDDPVSKRISHFYVDDPAALERLAKRWVSGGLAPFFLCGYNYELYLVSKGEVTKSFSINLERGCNTLVDGQGRSFWFDPSLIEDAEADLKKPRVEEKAFADRAEARRYLAEVPKDPAFLMLLDPEWRRFDGELRFMTACEASADDKACLDSVVRRVKERYPGAEFLPRTNAQTYQGGKVTEIGVVLACTEAFRKEFDLFPVGKDAWRPFPLKLTAVFKP